MAADTRMTKVRDCRARTGWLSVTMGVAMAAGCATKKQKPEDVWIAPPYVGWADVSSQPVPEVTDEYRLLQTEPSKGLFPAAIAVTRVSRERADEDRPEAPPRPRIALHPKNETLRFNAAFDDLVAVSEVFPIAQRTLGGGEAVPSQILAAYRALDARIGLIYAVNELARDRTEIIAVLYEVRTGKPLACYHCAETSKLPPEDAEKNSRKIDYWKTDSRALARRSFEKLVHASLRELILRDEPAPLEDKSGWTPIVPPLRPEWPPTRDRRGN